MEQDERKRIEKQVQDEFERKKREADAKRLVAQAEARIKREMDQAQEKRK